jgi:hypothetical protein
VRSLGTKLLFPIHKPVFYTINMEDKKDRPLTIIIDETEMKEQNDWPDGLSSQEASER